MSDLTAERYKTTMCYGDGSASQEMTVPRGSLAPGRIPPGLLRASIISALTTSAPFAERTSHWPELTFPIQPKFDVNLTTPQAPRLRHDFDSWQPSTAAMNSRDMHASSKQRNRCLQVLESVQRFAGSLAAAQPR
ncbi:hypothetical protein BH11MYX2_BH11MYX2_25290 [soil metagenome]